LRAGWFRGIGLLIVAVLIGLGIAPAHHVSAHPLGNFTTNRYSRIEFSAGAVQITYVLDYAEIPTFQEMKFLDPDDDGALSAGEETAWLDQRIPVIVKGLRLVVGTSVLPLEVVDRSAQLLPGQGGLPILRVEMHLRTHLPAGWQRDTSGGYTDRNYQDRLGWREVVIQGGPGVRVVESSASDTDRSNELRNYPADAVQHPLNQSEATFTLAPGNGTPAASTAGDAAAEVQATERGGRATDRVASLIANEEMTPLVVGISILLAMFWGAVHALSPGHGKTIVAAYIVGARGTAKHAAFLGATVTITHTAGVFALGLVTLYLSRYILPETLYPWLTVISGALVVLIGITLFYRRLRAPSHEHHHHHHHDHHDDGHSHPHSHEHAHDHSHSHLPPGADGGPVTWRALLALGVSGGLIPCPSALVLLLGAISLDRLELGIVLVTAFSVGLAAVLTAIGLLLVYARRIFDRVSFTPRIPRLLPAASALVVSIAGLVIVAEALQQAGVV
jgi:ABC-type nickel/cobalt efflux system permease component RcnA